MSDALVAIRPRGGPRAASSPRLRLVVAPPSGAGPQYARPLLDDGIDLWAARYPGREIRQAEPFASSIDAIADELAAALLTVHDTVPLPLVLLGNSMGAGVAVEMARRIESQRPDALHGVVLAGRAAPGHADAGDAERLRVLSNDDIRLGRWVASLGGTPAELIADPDFMAMLLPVLRADLLVSLDHDGLVGARLRAPVVLACGACDPVVTLDSMRGWAAVTSGTVRELALPGGHHGVVEAAGHVLSAVRALVGRG